MKVDSNRVRNPTALSLPEIQSALDRCGELVIQFDGFSHYTPDLLSTLNAACKASSDRLTVRFYGHVRTGFDAGILAQLPDVKSLALDCLLHIRREEALFALPNLVRLEFGVFEFDQPGLLSNLPLSRLRALAVDGTRWKNIDLSPLSQAISLESLRIEGHTRGIGAIRGLPRLQDITLRSLPATQQLDALNDLPALTRLLLILGGRNHLDEFQSQSLNTLLLLRIKGLQNLGALARFPALRRLQIEDQPRLVAIDTGGVALEGLKIDNCKALRVLGGLETQDQLREICISRVGLDLAPLRDFPWRTGVKTVSLRSSSQRWNEATAATLAGRGHGAAPTLPRY